MKQGPNPFLPAEPGMANGELLGLLILLVLFLVSSIAFIVFKVGDRGKEKEAIETLVSSDASADSESLTGINQSMADVPQVEIYHGPTGIN